MSKRRWLLLLFGAFLLIWQSTTSQVAAQCAAGMTCLPENGGEAVLYADCHMDDLDYCHGTGARAEYCSCEGSADCSCEIGPGTECPTADDSEWDCYCAETRGVCAYSEKTPVVKSILSLANPIP